MVLHEIFSSIMFIKSYLPSNTIILSTIGLGAIFYKGALLAAPIVKPFFLTTFKPIIIGIVSMGNVIPLLNHIAKKQDLHQEILGTVSIGQYEHSKKILNEVNEIKEIYITKTSEIISAFNSFIENQKATLALLNEKLDALSERVVDLGKGVKFLFEEIKRLKASAGPEKLTYHKEDDFQNGASSLLDNIDLGKSKFNFKEKFLCGEKESYIEEIYNSLIKKPSSIIVNMMTEGEEEHLNKNNEETVENLFNKIATPLPTKELNVGEVQPLSSDFNLSREKEEEIEQKVNDNLKTYQEKMSTIVEENKELLDAESPEVIDQSFSQEERIAVKKLSSDQQYSNLYVTKTMLSLVCNSSIGIGFSSFVLSMGFGSLTLYGVSKGLHIPTSAPEDSPILAKVASSLIANGSIVLLSTIFMPKVNKQLKKFGEYIQDDLEKNTLYEGGLTKAEIEEKLLEEGLPKEKITFLEESSDPSLKLIAFVKILVDDKGAEKALNLVNSAYGSSKQNIPQIPLLENLSGGINKTTSKSLEIIKEMTE